MRVKRPSPELIAARKFEIAKRYAQKSRVGKRSRSMAAIRLSELTRWLHDAYGEGTELEASDDGYAIVRLFAHHLGGLPDAPRRITVWRDSYAPWLDPRNLERLISEVVSCPLKFSADKLAWKIRLTDAKRTELKIKTIGAIDCNRDQRKARQRKRRAEREKARRAAKRTTPACPTYRLLYI
jgi:hypothetical protein